MKIGVILAAILLSTFTNAAGAADIKVAAAASMSDAINAAAKVFTTQTGHSVTPIFAASSTLAKQVEHGLPVDVFISADLKWMDYLAERGAIAPDTRQILAKNALVLMGQGEAVDIAKADFAQLLGDQRLVTGDPAHVPVGRYAQQALTHLGQWDVVEPRLARADSVRAALALVERGEARFGIVYATDASTAKDLKILGIFSANSHDPVEYPIALIKHGQKEGMDFINFLTSAQGQAILVKFGFKAM